MRISDWSSRRVLFRSILAGTAGGSDRTDSLAGIGFDVENIGFCLQKSAWIDRLAVQADFEMQVAAGRTAGRAHFGDLLPGGDLRADLGREARQVGVAGQDALTMIDLDDIAIADRKSVV